MNVRELLKALEDVPLDLEVVVGYEGTYNGFGVEAEVWTDPRDDAHANSGKTFFMVSTV